MTDLTITVRGSHTARHQTERATVTLSVSTEGPDRSIVFEGATRSARLVRERIEGRVDPDAGPIVSWSSDRVQVWSEKPWSSDGSQLALVFHALVGFVVRFSDVGELERFLDDVAAVEGAAVSDLGWTLSERSRIAALDEVRSRAVDDAVQKAGVYARSVGLETVRPVAIADAGMLGGDSGAPRGSEPAAPRASRMAGMSTGSGPALSLRPAEIEVTADVDVRFVAG